MCEPLPCLSCDIAENADWTASRWLQCRSRIASVSGGTGAGGLRLSRPVPGSVTVSFLVLVPVLVSVLGLIWVPLLAPVWFSVPVPVPALVSFSVSISVSVSVPVPSHELGHRDPPLTLPGPVGFCCTRRSAAYAYRPATGGQCVLVYLVGSHIWPAGRLLRPRSRHHWRYFIRPGSAQWTF